MDRLEQAEYETIPIRKPLESKRDYLCRVFATRLRHDLSKSDKHLLIVKRLTTTI